MRIFYWANYNNFEVNKYIQILITTMVCSMLRIVTDSTPDDLLALVYLLPKKIAPAHEGMELGIGESIIIKALAEAFGRTEKHAKKQLEGNGDLGLVAQESRSSQSLMMKTDALTIAKFFNTFQLIDKQSLKDSQNKKKNHIKALLVAATGCESLYLVCLLQAAKIVKQVNSVLPVYNMIVPALLKDGVWNLSKTCSFTLGVPIGPMLAKSIKNISKVADKFQNTNFTYEYKYDEQCTQAILTIEKYSRNAERNTGKYPDSNKVNLVLFSYLLYIFSILCDCAIRLYGSFEEDPGFFKFATVVTTNNPEESNIPCVYGAFLLACYDIDNEGYQNICKIGSGFSKQELENRSNGLRSKVILKTKPYYMHGDKIIPDVWFEPSEVWEVKAAELTISCVYFAAFGKGISLQFPRLVKVREDKSPEKASSSAEVVEMYNVQKLREQNKR
ncbi:hypothetical protein P3X46_000148 [Hevea brasiliensis]|uniref:DNA ligase ATP-dependent N-terminal domain-containing protein n=1 Tax=Hevea brasiliensis TaxID=3981 RepID=A0ABQ9ND65_HEVBR|nr:hypothetical protein P3X46_000148 [Hevea brasiliensis]